MRKRLSEDVFMKKCIYTGDTKDVSFEHCWLYGGKQINELWAIVPLRRDLNVNMTSEVKNYCRWISLMRATSKDLAKYPRKNWAQEKKYLDAMFLKKSMVQ